MRRQGGYPANHNAFKNANASGIDGSQYLQASSGMGASDNMLGTISLWFNSNETTDAYLFTVADDASGTNITLELKLAMGPNTIDLYLEDPIESEWVRFRSTNTIPDSDNQWRHLLVSYVFGGGATACTMYLDGSDIGAYIYLSSLGLASGLIRVRLSYNYWKIGNTFPNAANYFSTAISEFFYQPNEVINDRGEMRKFITPHKRPKYLGAFGERGLTVGSGDTKPLIYLPNAAASFGTNAGRGNNFTVNNGPYTTPATTPSTP